MNLEAVDTEIALIAQLAESTRLPLARWHLLRQQASRAALAGQFAIARDRSEEARQLRSGSRTSPARGCHMRSPSRWRACAATPPSSSRISSRSWRPPRRSRSSMPRKPRHCSRRPDRRGAGRYETLRRAARRRRQGRPHARLLIQLMDLIIAFRTPARAGHLRPAPPAPRRRHGRVRAGDPVRLGALAAGPAGRPARPDRAGAGPLRPGPGDQHPARRPAIRRLDQAGLGRDAGRTRGRR